MNKKGFGMFKRACNCGDEGLSTLLLQVQSPVSGKDLRVLNDCISLSALAKIALKRCKHMHYNSKNTLIIRT
jgi:hypothetical protein